MQIVDLTPEHEPLYFACLEPWSDDIREAGDHKERWFRETAPKGLRVKLAVNDAGNVGGMIEYLPIEHSFVQGSGLYLITCIWVHGHKKGVGNQQKRGMGKALLAAAEEDARDRNAKGMAAFGIFLPFWIRAGWYKKHGYAKVDSKEGMQLLWKPFADGAQPPAWVKKRYVPELTPGRVTVTSLTSGRCPAGSMVHERARRASTELGDKVIFREVHTNSREALVTYGEWDGLWVDGRQVRTGPPPSYDKIRGIIQGRVKKLR